MKKLVLLVTTIIVFCWITGEAQVKNPGLKSQRESLGTLNIVDALNEKKIKVEAEGAGLSAVSIKVVRNTDEKIKILIPVGTFFVNRGKAQNMVSTEDVVLDLTRRKEIVHSVPAACANAHKDVPNASSKFDITVSSASEELKRLMGIIGRKKPSNEIKQVAVWIVTDNISRPELDSRYRRSFGLSSWPAVTNDSVIKAMQIVEKAGINVTQKAISKVSAIKALSSKDQAIRTYSLNILGARDEDRMGILIEVLEDTDWMIRRIAVKTLGEIKDNRAVDPLIVSLERESLGAKSYRRKWLGGLNKNEQVMLSIVEALGEIGDVRGIEPLINASKIVDSSYYYVIAGSLIKIDSQNPRVKEHLVATLKRRGSYVAQGAAAEALGRIKDGQAVEPLIAALKDITPSVREHAAEALGDIKDSRAIEPLITALNDKYVKGAAANALRKITGKDFGIDQAKWQKWWYQKKGFHLKGR